MSHTINREISEIEADLEACRQIRARFPDARLERSTPGSPGFWVSDSLKPEECDEFRIGGHDVVRVGTLVGGKMVALPLRFGETVAAFLMRLREKDHELFRALAAFAAEQTKT